ncbi:amino acid permease [candidate division KSB1 bacterium]|nr:amino acid permease [candidate division KSB1 bacterium]
MTTLKKDLSLFDLTMIAIGSVIGSGIFLTPNLIARTLMLPQWILLVWILGGIMALTGALTFAELGARFPQAGGVYVYLTQGYGKLAGFLYGWVYFLIVNTGAIAALSLAFATYLGYFIPLNAVTLKLVAVIGIVFLSWLNIRGVKTGAIFSDLFTVLKIVGILGLILVGLSLGRKSALDFSKLNWVIPAGLLGSLGRAMVGVIWSCGGWQHASFTAGEAKRPQRDVPVAMVLGAVAITLIYLLTNIAYLKLLTPAQIANSPRVAADAIETVLGPIGGSLIAIAIFISTIGTTGIYTLTAPRIYFAMAQDGLFFKKVAALHPRFQTPFWAIGFQSLWAMLLILFWGTFENLIAYVVFSDAIFFALAAGVVFILRVREPGREQSYRTPGYPITPLIFIGLEVWFVVTIFLQQPLQSGAGLAFVALGIPVYYFWKKRLT